MAVPSSWVKVPLIVAPATTAAFVDCSTYQVELLKIPWATKVFPEVNGESPVMVAVSVSFAELYSVGSPFVKVPPLETIVDEPTADKLEPVRLANPICTFDANMDIFKDG